MKFESKYGIISLEINFDNIVVESTIPFKKYKKTYPTKDIEIAQTDYKSLVEEVTKIIEEMEKEKTKKLVKDSTVAKKLRRILKSGIKKVLLYGPTGTGKTFAILNLLKTMKKDGEIDNYLAMTFSSGMEDIDFLGKYLPQKDRTIKFDPSTFIRFIKKNYNKKIAVLFDEFNRASSKMLNILIPMLDGRNGRVVVENYITGETITVPEENVVFLFTANFGGSYTGTFHLDEAILNRIDAALFIDYDKEIEKAILNDIPNKNVRKIAENIVDFFRELYKKQVIHPFTTRDVKTMTKLLLSVSSTDTDAIVEAIEPVLYKVAKTDNLGYIDEEIVAELKSMLNKLDKEDEDD